MVPAAINPDPGYYIHLPPASCCRLSALLHPLQSTHCLAACKQEYQITGMPLVLQQSAQRLPLHDRVYKSLSMRFTHRTGVTHFPQWGGACGLTEGLDWKPCRSPGSMGKAKHSCMDFEPDPGWPPLLQCFLRRWSVTASLPSIYALLIF